MHAALPCTDRRERNFVRDTVYINEKCPLTRASQKKVRDPCEMCPPLLTVSPATVSLGGPGAGSQLSVSSEPRRTRVHRHSVRLPLSHSD